MSGETFEWNPSHKVPDEPFIRRIQKRRFEDHSQGVSYGLYSEMVPDKGSMINSKVFI